MTDHPTSIILSQIPFFQTSQLILKVIMADMSGSELAIPSISVDLAITPPEYSHQAGQDGIPSLSITATLAPSAPKPVTILTWPTIFNPSLALKRRNFTVQNISHDPPTPIKLEITKGPKRPAFQRRKGTSDEKYYITLHPGQKSTIAEQPLNIVQRTGSDGETHLFQPGNTYSLGVSEEGDKIRNWWWGTTDDVLDEVDGPPKDVSGIVGSGDILLSADLVHFKICE
ncbi:hypothetical protein G7054_g13901 [Neopestalotiopsis clavispora]|nr:hypothetical protein G7054_g13901 [Neopestalotiopsis clavispora]